MNFTYILSASLLIGGFYTLYQFFNLKQSKKRHIPKNTKWKACTVCPDCENVFNNESGYRTQYMCPDCGKNTILDCSFRWLNDNIETQNRERETKNA